jgi:DNA-directed RNA polymerase I, II, and III subunit RPABC2
MSDIEYDSDVVTNDSDDESDAESVDGSLGNQNPAINPNTEFDIENDDVDGDDETAPGDADEDDEDEVKDGLDVEPADISDDDSDDENMQKMRKLKDTLSDYHSEHNLLSFDEIKPLTLVRRNNKNIIIDDNHKTTPILTKYEYTKIIGLRTVQLENGLKPLITIDNNIIDPYVIAQMELKEKKLPFIIKRPLPDGRFEYWPIHELEILV